MKTIKFYTLGCKVNQYDTQSIRERFMRAGFRELEDSQPADIYVINTCTVTQRADSQSLNLIRRAKRQNLGAKIIVTGCLTELDEDKIKNLDCQTTIVKNKDKEKFFLGITENNYPCESVKNPYESVSKGISYFKAHTRAFLKIQDGCDNQCSYCKVPLVRGVSKSRPLSDIILEAERLVGNGFREIVLTGICLGAYGRDLKDNVTLVNVIEALEEVAGLLRIRLSSIEAGDISDALINKMAPSQKLCRHLHIPIQSGDDEILKKMNRRYTFRDYVHLTLRIKALIPEIAITTDVLVGFPQETEENFQNTIKLIQKVAPLKAHIFPYSPRNGTMASSFKNTLNPQVVKQRILRLKSICENCSLIYKKQFLNKKMDVLIEGRLKKDKGWWEGYTENYIKIKVKSELNLKNKLIPLRLEKIDKDSVLADFD